MMTKSEKINLAATIIGPIIIVAVLGWVSWSFNARMIIERQAADKFNADTYVPKVWFEKSQDETNKKLDVLTTDVATIKGELSGGVVRTKSN